MSLKPHNINLFYLSVKSCKDVELQLIRKDYDYTNGGNII